MRLPKLQKWDVVEVHWSDACGVADGWETLDEESTAIHGCVTVGQVYSQRRDAVTIVLSRDDVTKKVDGAITIPLVTITGFRKFKPLR